MTRRLFLFDFDGVIVDSYKIFREMSKRTFDALGMSHLGEEEAYLDLFEDNFYESLVERGVDLEEFRRIARTVVPRLEGQPIRLVGELRPVVEELARADTLVIISSNSRTFITRALSESGYHRFFEEILGSEFMLSKVKKINHAVEARGFSREHAYFIGDTAGDMREARRAQVRTVAVTWGWHSEERLLKASPDYVIHSPRELLTM